MGEDNEAAGGLTAGVVAGIIMAWNAVAVWIKENL